MRAPSLSIIKRGGCAFSTVRNTRSGSSSSIRAGWYSSMRGKSCARAYSRSHVFKRSRCLIDLIIVGLALSNSKAAIPNLKQLTIDSDAEIFNEGRRLQRNTVNDFFPPRPVASKSALRQAVQSRPLDRVSHSTNGEVERGALADMPTFPPCVRRAVGGIFRRGGGRSEANSQTSGRTCR